MSSPTPRVSVIIATYNRSNVLGYAIQSVLWQTFQDFELLVIGDGCTDDSADVVASFSDPRVRWHNLPENSGNQATPNNVGLTMARGEYIAYLGHDDLWYPTHLALLIARLQETGADVAYTLCEHIAPAETGLRLITGFSPSGEYERGLVIPPSSFMHKREMMPEMGGWRDYRALTISPDTEILMRAFDHGKKFAAVNELTVFKFNASWRRNAYREKSSREQTEYARRIQSEPDFLYREMLAVARYCTLTNPEIILRTVKRPDAAPRGRRVEESRRFRGLEAKALEPTSRVRLWSWRVGRAFATLLRGVLRRALNWLGD
jgi:glycosyltransferase involved in cell wall biosynthesis